MAESNEQGKKIGQLISKAWSNEEFKKRLLSDTMAVLKENGISVPEGVTVKAVENTDKVFHIVIPPKPAGPELSDEELDKVAGGFEWCPWDENLRRCSHYINHPLTY